MSERHISDSVLAEAKLLVCVGTGGVGKTTTSAALALRAAALGRRTLEKFHLILCWLKMGSSLKPSAVEPAVARDIAAASAATSCSLLTRACAAKS